ncbi:amino acid ABC transporter ATP-binding protein [Enterococcus olivae]
MLKIEGLSKEYEGNVVLDKIDLEVKKGDVIGIIGPSGTGKSTLLRTINLLEKPEEGKILLDDISLEFPLKSADRKKVFELRSRTGMVFQRFNLLKHKTALQNVMEGLITVQRKSKEEAEKLALEALAQVGVAKWRNHYPKHLSGGQQQRVAIARTLVMRPDVILLDEPTSSLDPELISEVLKVIKEIADKGYTMLLVSHEMNFIRKVSNRVLFLDGGHIVEDGSPQEVFNYPKHKRTIQFFQKMDILANHEIETKQRQVI